MPPRVARMMVNLSECNEGKGSPRPLCGVGTILQEALLEKAVLLGWIRTHGVLKRQKKISIGSRRNMSLKARISVWCRGGGSAS